MTDQHAEKKGKSIEDIVDEGINPLITHYQGIKSKDFNSRISAFEEFFQKEIPTFIQSHVEDTIHGEKGAYNAAVSALNGIAPHETAKINSEDEITKILETYVDQFLRNVYSKFDETVAHAEKEGLSTEEIRSLKGTIFARYHRRQDGSAINPLDEKFIKQFKGKTKAQIKLSIRNIADITRESYNRYVMSKATDLFNEEDLLDMSKYVKSLMDKAGYMHDDHPLTKSLGDLVADITTYYSRGNLAERGYKSKPAAAPEHGGGAHGGGHGAPAHGGGHGGGAAPGHGHH